jgi:ectoine hydroxylase-related dioxygenase (phytanoyl-CoA dioxygenase family)
MVLLDDFTGATGPTRFHPDVTVEAPDPDDFERRAHRLEAPAGSACWFHGRIWHDSLPNTTDRPRRAVLAAMVRPYLRQRFDMPGMVAHLSPETLPVTIQRRLGFDKVAPGSYEEYFLPDAVRKQELLRRSIARERGVDAGAVTPG